MKIIVFGLAVTSSWGNGHATTYRALLGALHQRKHRIVFFEKNQEWYTSNRDLPNPEFCNVQSFQDWSSILSTVRRELSDCDVAIVGSYFPEANQAIPELLSSKVPVKVFYDIDTPITLNKLRSGSTGYLQPRHISAFDLYLSFTGGPILRQLQIEFGARRVLPLYCSFEPEKYFPRGKFRRYQCDMSYMGTYAADRQQKLEALFSTSANSLPQMNFLLAGPQYPSKIKWPENVRHIKHLSPRWHPHFYSSSRVTLNLTRKEMVSWGYSPSVRLFEAAACGAAIISDSWPGLNDFFVAGKDILLAGNANQVISYLKDVEEQELTRMGMRARDRVLAEHTSTHRAIEFEKYIALAKSKEAPLRIPAPAASPLLSGHASARPSG